LRTGRIQNEALQAVNVFRPTGGGVLNATEFSFNAQLSNALIVAWNFSNPTPTLLDGFVQVQGSPTDRITLIRPTVGRPRWCTLGVPPAVTSVSAFTTPTTTTTTATVPVINLTHSSEGPASTQGSPSSTSSARSSNADVDGTSADERSDAVSNGATDVGSDLALPIGLGVAGGVMLLCACLVIASVLVRRGKRMRESTSVESAGDKRTTETVTAPSHYNNVDAIHSSNANHYGQLASNEV
jgi:hypothetical protein